MDQQRTACLELPGVSRAIEAPRPAEAPVVAAIAMIAPETTWRDRIAGYLATEGFLVFVDTAGDVVFDHRARSFDAALVDLGLRERSAIAICAAWRRRTSAPIIAVASHRDDPDILAAYAAGADHVATASITSRHLLAHLRAMMRRSRPRRPTSADYAAHMPIRLDAERHVASVRGAEVELSVDEYEFLRLLLDRAGRVVPRSELIESIAIASRGGRAVDVLVRRLREKLESVDEQRRITVVRGIGFRFDIGKGAASEATT